jgi:hypothetical protein
LDFWASGIERLSRVMGMEVQMQMETKLETEMALKVDEL